jgi:hypothetical protein
MKWILKNGCTVQEAQQKFGELFPHLLVKFYNKDHKPGQGNKSENELKPHEKLTFRTAVTSDDVVIQLHGGLKTENFERLMREEFGVNVQIYRKSGKIWLQTMQTDGWTLAEQERMASEMDN